VHKIWKLNWDYIWSTTFLDNGQLGARRQGFAKVGQCVKELRTVNALESKQPRALPPLSHLPQFPSLLKSEPAVAPHCRRTLGSFKANSHPTRRGLDRPNTDKFAAVVCADHIESSRLDPSLSFTSLRTDLDSQQLPAPGRRRETGPSPSRPPHRVAERQSPPTCTHGHVSQEIILAHTLLSSLTCLLCSILI
jgi:hypothetical protein